MLLVLPFNSADSRLALSLAKYLELVGPYKAHELLLVAPNDCQEQVNELQLAIGDQFSKVHVHYVINIRKGWPQAPNQMFHSTAMKIMTDIPCECWYFFEPDNTPLKPGWINLIYDEYRRVQRPFLGAIHPSYWKRRDEEGKMVFIQDGTHLVGTSIYPRDVLRYSRLFKTILYAEIPWDVYWQWEVNKFAASTGLIQHEWRSFKYRRDPNSGEIKGERAPGTLPYDPRPIPPDACVLHGCKDGSLMKIMREMFESRDQPVQEALPA